MNSLVPIFFAACCAALANLFFRKNSVRLSADLSINGYLLYFYGISFLFAFVAYPDLWLKSFDTGVFALGSVVGILNVAMMICLGKTLKLGPSGLTFAFQNSSAVFPGLLLFIFFGTAYGYDYSWLHFLGVILVMLGLFIGSHDKGNANNSSRQWLLYALLCMLIQILALLTIQGRCVLWQCHIITQDDLWFIPGQFALPFVFMIFLNLQERRGIALREVAFGTLGGLSNFASTAFLLMATASVAPQYTGMILPFFAVATIVLCNLWAWWLYDEPFNWKTNALCAAGIIIGLI